MSYTYLQERGEESSAEFFSDIPAFVLSRLNRTAVRFCCNDNATESCQSFQSGTTCEPSTESPGGDSSTSSAVGSHARTFQQQEREPGSTENEADCGVKWHALFRKYDRDSRSWKTHRCLFSEVCPEYSLTLPKWGWMRGGELFRRQTPSFLMEIRAYITSARESGSLQIPTPGAAKANNDVTLTVSGDGRDKPNKLGWWVAVATPKASDAERGGRGDLLQQVRGNQNKHFANQVPTPMARDHKSGKVSQVTMEKNSCPLSEVIGGNLNPPWVAWLQGFPIEWLSCEPLAMHKFQQWLHSHGRSLVRKSLDKQP